MFITLRPKRSSDLFAMVGRKVTVLPVALAFMGKRPADFSPVLVNNPFPASGARCGVREAHSRAAVRGRL